jgi:DNA-binding LacI/PurR family transcriptional regulator
VQLLSGIQEVAYQEGHELLVLHDNSAIKWEKMDGILFCSNEPKSMIPILPPGMPCVSLLFPLNKISSVTADDSAGISAVIDHLIGLGHRNIAFLTGVDPLSQQRRLGFQRALDKAKITMNPKWVRTLPPPIEPGEGYFVDAGRRGIKQWLREDWQELGCTALLAHNDETAIGAIESLQEAGIHVPSELSVVGFDGTEITKYFEPRLTTVEVPLHDIGEAATRILVEQISKPLSALKRKPRPQIRVLPTRLRVGKSTARPATVGGQV